MTVDVREIRRDFPYLDTCVYMNTAAVGICPSGSGAAAARFYDDFKSKGFDARDAWRDVEVDLQGTLARVLKTTEHAIGFVGSTTEALNLVAHAIHILPGEEVVFAADEFPSVRLAWERHRQAGVDLRPVSITKEEERTSAIAAAVGARTRVVCVSHVHWCTGTRVDLRQLKDACRPYGAMLVVDGVQAAGAVDVDASIADVYAGSVFKWFLSAFGVAFLAIRKELELRLDPAFRGYTNEPPSRALRYAHINYPGLTVLHASLNYLESIGWSHIYGRVAALTELLHNHLQRAGLSVVTPLSARAGIVSVSHPQAAAIVENLWKHGCRAELRDGLVRLSPNFYNTEEEVHRLVEVLVRL
jgi:cysteine desulfurase/selenocysteine lyase